MSGIKDPLAVLEETGYALDPVWMLWRREK
jgi:hypothetical protein